MKKEFWVDLRSWNKEYAVTAIESGADRLVLDVGSLDAAKRLGRIKAVISQGSMSSEPSSATGECGKSDELVIGKDVFEVEITDKKSENDAVKLSKKGYVVVKTTDWNVIPLENLAAQSEMIIAAVSDAREAAMALGVLEKGVSGIMLKPSSASVISGVAKLMKENSGSVELTRFKVKSVEPVGMGDRVCVDTCSLLKDGEGMMIGSSSSAFLLVHAETLENPYVAPRPFRVNAGAVHAYAVMADGRTKYLAEVKAGDSVLIADSQGKTSEATVGRVKIERRPMLLVTAVSVGDGDGNATGNGGKEISAILQNAETIRLVSGDKKPVSVVDLKEGDIILGRVEEGGRHFGYAVKETILEK